MCITVGFKFFLFPTVNVHESLTSDNDMSIRISEASDFDQGRGRSELNPLWWTRYILFLYFPASGDKGQQHDLLWIHTKNSIFLKKNRSSESGWYTAKASKLRSLKNSGILKIFHTFLMKYSDLARKTGQNDTQLAMFSTKFHRV